MAFLSELRETAAKFPSGRLITCRELEKIRIVKRGGVFVKCLTQPEIARGALSDLHKALQNIWGKKNGKRPE